MSEIQKAVDKLGNPAYELIHDRVTTLTRRELKDFALLLGANDGPNVLYGNHKRRMEQTRERCYDTEFKSIIGDWW